MRLIHSANERFTFSLGKQERQLLLTLLRRYPLIPAAHQPLSRSAPAREAEANQRLLDEALAEQRLENRRALDALLHDPRRFQETQTGCRLILSAADIQWLLQVLNDIRIGSWILLGSPDNSARDFEWNEGTALHLWTMELAGEFEMNLLKAVQSRGAA